MNTNIRKRKTPVIIFLHGNSMSARIWDEQFQSELLEDYTLVAFDLPGHGASEKSASPEENYTVSGYATVLSEQINETVREEFLLVGLSLGGNVGVEALSNLPRCIGLMTVCTSVVGKPAALEKMFFPNPALATVFKEEASKEELDLLVKSYFAKGNESTPNTLREDFRRTDPRCRSSLAKSIAAGNYEDEIIILSKAHVPVALVSGSQDQLLNPQYLQELQVPKWKDDLILVPDAGHMPQLENSAYFNNLLREFMEHCLHEKQARNVNGLNQNKTE